MNVIRHKKKAASFQPLFEPPIDNSPTPYTKIRYCARCGNLVSYFDFISKRMKLRGSFILEQLIGLWFRFKDDAQALHCEKCVSCYL